MLRQNSEIQDTRLMKCSHCHARFSADWAQPAPGGSSAPGVFLLLALALCGASALTLYLDLRTVGWICFVFALFVTIQIPIAWSDCRSKSGLSAHGGGTCPTCGADNPVRLWSF